MSPNWGRIEALGIPRWEFLERRIQLARVYVEEKKRGERKREQNAWK
jgi:hypothetical protein